MALLRRSREAQSALGTAPAPSTGGFGGRLGVEDATPSSFDRARRSIAGRVDALRDDLETGAFGLRFKEAVAKLGLTRAGAAAVVAAVLLWLSARIVAGTAMYLFAYGLGLAVFAAVA
ncbi:MAG: hypothetical protein JWM40_2749, partial [Frankiales bacterium]|nr:hypothetical protein [Frankiales bacterium]